MRYPVKAVTLFTSISMALGVNAAVMTPANNHVNISTQPRAHSNIPTNIVRTFDKNQNAYQFFAYNPYTNTAAKLVKYQGGNPELAKEAWTKSFSLPDSPALHVTNLMVDKDTLILAGSSTASSALLDHVKPVGKTMAFVAAFNALDGKILWKKAIQVAVNNKEGVIFPDNLQIKNDTLILNGTTNAGLSVYAQVDEPQSAKDHFEVSVALESGQLLSTSLSKLSDSPALTNSVVQQENPSNGPIVDSMVDWGVGKAMDWTDSKIMQAFGIKSSDEVIEDDLNVLNGKMNQALEDLNNIQQQLNQLLGDFAVLYNQVLADQSQSYQVELGMLQNGIQGNWDQFSNATSNVGSLSDLNNNQSALNSLTPLLTDNYLSSVWTHLIELTNTDQTSGFYAILTHALSSQMKAQFNESSWGMGADPIKYIDGYNESLMNVYMSALVSVQQVYNILMTAAYLQANHIAGFGNLTSPVPGVNPSDSFATQQAKINAVFNNLLQGQRDSNNNLVGIPGIFDVTASLLISDYYNMTAQYPSDWSSTGLPTYAQAYANNYQPELAKTQSQMPPSWTTACTGGVCNATPWSASCDVYGWSGASAYPYEGHYGNGTLTTLCNGESISLDLNTRETNNTPLALYAYGQAMLEPENYNPTASYVILGSSSSVKAFEVKFSGSDNYFYIGQQGFQTQAPWIEALSNPGSMCTSGTCEYAWTFTGGSSSYAWTLDSNAYIHSHSGTYSYNSINVVKFPDGYNGLINLYSQGHDVGDDNISWDFGLQCVKGMICSGLGITDLVLGTTKLTFNVTNTNAPFLSYSNY